MNRGHRTIGPVAALAGWISTGAALGALVGARTVATNGSIVGAHDTVVFALWCALAYGALGALAGLFAQVIASLAARLPGGDRARARSTAGYHAHALVALTAGGAYVLGSAVAARASEWAIEIDRSVVLPALALAAAAVVLGVGVLARTPLGGPAARVRTGLWLPALAVLATAVAALQSGPDPDAEGPLPGDPLLVAGDSRQVVLIGLDGADWEHLEPLIDAGRLPNWERLIGDGVVAQLETQLPTWSPIIWNTIVTGVPGSVHGILDFTAIPLPGMRREVQRLRAARRLAQNPLPDGPPVPAHTGLAPLVELGVGRGLLREEPIHGYHRRAPALQNVLSDLGLRVASVRWWASWPAEEVNGYVVSDDRVRAAALRLRETGRSSAAATHPPELLEELAGLEGTVDPDRSWDDAAPEESVRRALELPLFGDLDDARRDALRADPALLRLAWNTWEDDRFGVAAVRYLLQKPGHIDYVAVYTCLVDVLGHRIEDLARRDPGYRPILDRAYEESDRLLGELLASGSPQTTWILVSDHGWSYTADRWGHYHAPPGVFLMSGAGVDSGVTLAAPPSTADVAPTVLALLGLPASEEMLGSVLVDVLAPELARAVPPRVASFGPYRPRWSGSIGAAATGLSREEELERLRALGYVQ